MPSIIGHSVTGATTAYVCKKRFQNINAKSFFILSLVAANMPDIDIFLHQSPLGQFEAFLHRNFFHSLLFAIFFGVTVGFLFYSKSVFRQKVELSIYFFLVTVSHNILDAFTKGFGVAFFHPFDKTQYNFPVTPLNPAGWNLNEFDANNALGRELFFVWLPMLVVSTLVYLYRKNKARRPLQ